MVGRRRILAVLSVAAGFTAVIGLWRSAAPSEGRNDMSHEEAVAAALPMVASVAKLSPYARVLNSYFQHWAYGRETRVLDIQFDADAWYALLRVGVKFSSDGVLKAVSDEQVLHWKLKLNEAADGKLIQTEVIGGSDAVDLLIAAGGDPGRFLKSAEAAGLLIRRWEVR